MARLSIIIGVIAALAIACNGMTLVDDNDARVSLREAKPLINGIVAAVFTPFKPDGSINYAAIDQQVVTLIADGVKNVFVAGTTGEGLSLSKDERKSLAAQWQRVASINNIGVLVHVGAESIADAVELAAHAESIGVYAIAAIPPTFFKPANTANLVAMMARIAAAAPRTPFYYYHFPGMTGALATGIDTFHTMAAAQIPTYYGMKFTDYDLFMATKCARYRDAQGNAYQVLFGKDEVMNAALINGITGFVGSTYNYAGKLFNGILNAWQAGNITAVQEGQVRSQQMVAAFLSVSADGVNAQKYLPYLRNKIDLGAPRLPQMPLSQAGLQALDAQLKAIGFYQWS